MGVTSRDPITQKPNYNNTPQTEADLQIAVDYAESVRTFKAATAPALPATGNWPGRQLFVGTEATPRKWDGSWSAAASGTDAAGWSYVTLPSGKRMYFREFLEWSAPQPFGPAGGSFWTQTRVSGIPVPTSRNWDSFVVDVSVYQKTGTNTGQGLIVGFLTGATGTGNLSLIFANPTALTITNTNMDLRSAITLIEK
jgi:hypothetical protein